MSATHLRVTNSAQLEYVKLRFAVELDQLVTRLDSVVMAEITINDSDLENLNGKVVVITGNALHQ